MTSPKEKRISWNSQNLIRIEINDKDNRIIGKFLQWLIDNDIYAENVGGMSGGGRYVSYYTPENYKKVEKYLDSFTHPTHRG